MAAWNSYPQKYYTDCKTSTRLSKSRLKKARL